MLATHCCAAWRCSTALRGLSATHAAVSQLCVPALAAGGGVLLMDEVLSIRLVLASVAVLGGVALVIFDRHHRQVRLRIKPS